MVRNRMKQQVNQHHSKCTFQVGDLVFLRLWPCNQSFLKLKGCHKLDPKFYGPYKVVQKIDFIAYKLELPPSFHVHPVFHVCCLKKMIGTNIRAQIVLPKLDNQVSIIFQPKAILNGSTHHLHSRSLTEVLIQWHIMQPEDSTWQPLLHIRK